MQRPQMRWCWRPEPCGLPRHLPAGALLHSVSAPHKAQRAGGPRVAAALRGARAACVAFAAQLSLPAPLMLTGPHPAVIGRQRAPPPRAPAPPWHHPSRARGLPPRNVRPLPGGDWSAARLPRRECGERGRSAQRWRHQGAKPDLRPLTQALRAPRLAHCRRSPDGEARRLL